MCIIPHIKQAHFFRLNIQRYTRFLPAQINNLHIPLTRSVSAKIVDQFLSVWAAAARGRNLRCWLPCEAKHRPLVAGKLLSSTPAAAPINTAMCTPTHSSATGRRARRTDALPTLDHGKPRLPNLQTAKYCFLSSEFRWLWRRLGDHGKPRLPNLQTAKVDTAVT
jgi:hypothetical protein